MPDSARSSQHTGRTKALCLVWALDAYVRVLGSAHRLPFVPNDVTCLNCWKRFRQGKGAA